MIHNILFHTLTTGSKYAITGGSDEQCKLFDLDKRVEHGVLAHHDGTVSCVTTHDLTSHLVTASDDNSIRSVLPQSCFMYLKTETFTVPCLILFWSDGYKNCNCLRKIINLILRRWCPCLGSPDFFFIVSSN